MPVVAERAAIHVGRIERFKASATVAAVCALFAAIGLVWLSLSLFELLQLITSPPIASGLVAIGFLAGPVVVLLLRGSAPADVAQDAPFKAGTGNEDLVALVTAVAEKLAPTTPLTAVTLALAGGVLSVHVPSAVTQPPPTHLRSADNHSAELSERSA